MKTIIFDLDGTLLPMNTDHFMKLYAKSVTEAFYDFDEAKDIFPQIMTSIGVTVKSPGGKANYDKFFDHFEKHMPREKMAYIPRFNDFYDNGFLKVKEATHVSPAMVEAVKVLKKKGYKLVIATNPIFPMRANEHRIAWAGLDINDFDHVTSFERNTSCKPFLAFYEEVLQSVGVQASDVLMVGNDVQEDLVIKKLGAKTFLIDDHILNRTPEKPVDSDYIGSYEDFLTFVKAL